MIEYFKIPFHRRAGKFFANLQFIILKYFTFTPKKMNKDIG